MPVDDFESKIAAQPRFRTNPDYEDSGIDWLGLIPARWGLRPLKYVAEFVNGCAFKPADWESDGVPIIRIENLNGGQAFNFFNGEVQPKYHVAQGDLLFGWSGNRGTSFGPFFWPNSGTHYLNQHIFNVKGFTCDKNWLYWALKAVTQYIESEAHGIIGMVHITKGKLGRIAVPWFSGDEQRAIAAFLDRETARIDELIAKKQRLIELLAEKRTAVISNAVTGGIDANAEKRAVRGRLFDSLPRHWKYSKLRWYCRSIRDGTHNPPPRASGVHRLLSVRNIIEGRFVPREDDRTMTAEAYAELQRSYTVEAGDVVLAIVGATTGKSAVVEVMENVTVQRSLAILRPRPGHLQTQFLNYWLHSLPLQAQISETVDKYAAQPGIYLDDVAELCIPIPPTSEQDLIAAYLSKACRSYDTLRDAIQLAIERLQEYRSALISAAVTGKIDVRRLPIQRSGLAKRLVNAAEFLFMRKDPESAFTPICNAIERVAREVYGESGRGTYKRFMKERMGLITRVGFGGGAILNLEFAVSPLYDEKGAVIKPNHTDADGVGLYSFEQIVYHLVRCNLDHDCEVAEVLRDSGSGTGRIAVESHTLFLPFDSVALGLLFAVMSEVHLRHELLGTVFEHVFWKQVPLIDLVGRKDRIEMLARSA